MVVTSPVVRRQGNSAVTSSATCYRLEGDELSSADPLAQKLFRSV
jgi:hypothetical protein